MFPDDRRYTPEHEWAQPRGEVVRVGITDYAQEALGDIVFVQLPAVGATVRAGEAVGEVESTKSVSDIYGPVAGEIVSRNDALDSAPELINSDPYGEGWLLEIRPADSAATDALLDAAGYAQEVDQH